MAIVTVKHVATVNGLRLYKREILKRESITEDIDAATAELGQLSDSGLQSTLETEKEVAHITTKNVRRLSLGGD